MNKKDCMQKLSDFIAELDCITGLSPTGRAERYILIKEIKKEIFFVRDYKLTEKVHDLFVKEFDKKVERFRPEKGV